MGGDGGVSSPVVGDSSCVSVSALLLGGGAGSGGGCCNTEGLFLRAGLTL